VTVPDGEDPAVRDALAPFALDCETTETEAAR